jgi:hypothetical protein
MRHGTIILYLYLIITKLIKKKTKMTKKGSLKGARQCCNKRKKETEQEISNINSMNANRMAEKQKIGKYKRSKY